MPGVLRSILVLQLVAAGLAAGQASEPGAGGRWAFGISMGASTFNGAASGTAETGERVAFVPYRPTFIAIGASRGRTTRIEASFGYAEPGLGVRGAPLTPDGETLPGVLIVLENVYRVYTLSAGVSTRVFRFRGGPEFRGAIGAGAERWVAPGAPARTIAACQAGVSVEIAISRKLTGRVLGELGFTPASPFRSGDLPE
ncbi:MAG TPA: hypothetical protein VF187_11420 [Gemmatimonadales bacterium]